MAVIPFQLTRDHILVEATIDGSEPLSMLIDSGSSFSSLDSQRANELKLVSQQTGFFEGGGDGSQQAKIAGGHNLRLGGACLENIALWIIPSHELNRLAGTPIDGVIGAQLFQRYVVEIDYAARNLRLYEPDLYASSQEGYKLSLTFLTGSVVPLLETKIISSDGSEITTRLLLDTGAGPTLLSKTLTDAHPTLVSSGPTIVAPKGRGLTAPMSYVVGRLREIRLGEVTIKEPVVMFSVDSRGVATRADFSGALGANILERFTVVVDYKRHSVTLKPNGEFNRRFEYDMSGMHVLTDASDFHHFEVDFVAADSTAGRKGILVGDVVDSVNGRPASKLTLDQIDRLLCQVGTLKLKMERHGRHYKIKLTLAPRI